MNKNREKLLNKFYKLYNVDENWTEARKILFQLLNKEPDSHWLLTSISSTYYEDKKYKMALRYSTKALKIKSRCPLALMDHATALDMLGRETEAIEIWKSLLRRGIRIAYGECSEGIRYALKILNTCRLRIGISYKDLNKIELAKKYLKLHLKNRKQGIPCNYTKKEVLKRLKSLE
jgi:tetratricopeptide (TPR) repeat protein